MINDDDISIDELKKAKQKREQESKKIFPKEIYNQDDENYEPENKELVIKLKVVTDFMNSWNVHEKNDTSGRKIILIIFASVLGFQLISLNVIIFLKAFNLADNISESFLKWFITEVFLQILSVVFFIVKYLYNNSYDKIMRAVLSLIQNNDKSSSIEEKKVKLNKTNNEEAAVTSTKN